MRMVKSGILLAGGCRLARLIFKPRSAPHRDPQGKEREGEWEHIPLALVRTCCVQLLGSNDFEKFDLEY